jgi:hypothetical protein
LGTTIKVFKLAMQAELHWRKPNSARLLFQWVHGVAFNGYGIAKAA